MTNFCTDLDSNPKVLSGTQFLLYLILFPSQLYLTVYTTTHIRTDTTMPLSLKFFCVIYHLMMMLFIFVSFQHYTYGRALQFPLNIGYCKFFIGVGYSSAVVFAESMLMFWFEKLQVTYRGTYIALSRGLNRFFYMLVAVTGSFTLTLGIVIALETNCTQREDNIDFNPFPNLAVNDLYTCGGYSSGLQNAYMATAVLVLWTLCAILIYQYITRFKTIALNRASYEEAEYDDIEKACIVAVLGCFTIVIVTVVAAALANAGFANLILGIVGVLNGMFIVCSFPWGSKLYSAMFGWYIRRKARIDELRKKTQLQTEKDAKSREVTESPNFTPYKKMAQRD